MRKKITAGSLNTLAFQRISTLIVFYKTRFLVTQFLKNSEGDWGAKIRIDGNFDGSTPQKETKLFGQKLQKMLKISLFFFPNFIRGAQKIA